MLQKIFFRSLKVYCQVSLWFYFSRWQIRTVAPLPRGPVIFVSNHQNAFLDAILIICSSYRNPWSLTRAEVFKKPLARKILTALQMIPVYRFRDGFSTLRMNDTMIETCSHLLTHNHSILIFGEGNHSYQWFLRSLQKGFARIALTAEEKNNWSLDVQIVPVGIQYESHMNFRSRVLISFGQAIPVKDYMNSQKSTQENLESLVNICEANLKPLVLNLPVDRYDEAVRYLLSNRIVKNDLVEQLDADKQVIHEFIHNPKTSNSLKPNRISWNPVRLYYAINHVIPRFILTSVIKNKVSDPQFIGSIKYALGMLLFPFFQVLQTGAIGIISGSWLVALAYLVSIQLSILAVRN